MKISILNWEKYNPRSDVKHPTWVRLDNDICASPAVFGLSAEERWVWTALICQASKKASGEFDLNVEWFSWYSGASEKAIRSTITKLATNGTITCKDVQARTDTPAPVQARTDTCTTNERTDEQTDTIVFDFEILYEQFPKRADGNNSKAQGIKKCKTRIKSQKQYDRFALAVTNYSKLKSGDLFSKSWNNWIEEWEDWVEPPKIIIPPASKLPSTQIPPAPILTVPDADSTQKYLQEREADFKSETPVDPAKVRELVRRVTGNLG